MKEKSSKVVLMRCCQREGEKKGAEMSEKAEEREREREELTKGDRNLKKDGYFRPFWVSDSTTQVSLLHIKHS